MNMIHTRIRVTDLLDHAAATGPLRKGNRRYWEADELRILTENYPKVGLPGCLKLLEGRTPSSVYGMANKLKLAAPVTEIARSEGRTRQIWHSSPEMDAKILERVADATKRRDIIKLADELERPRWWVSKRARMLGGVPPRFKEPPWHSRELEMLADQPYKSDIALQRMLKKAGFQRSETAIHVKLKRMNADRTDPAHCTAGQLARFLGVDQKTPTAWIDKGWLKAKRRGTKRIKQQGGDQWWISYHDIRTFCLRYAWSIDVRKVDKFWLFELLSREGAHFKGRNIYLEEAELQALVVLLRQKNRYQDHILKALERVERKLLTLARTMVKERV